MLQEIETIKLSIFCPSPLESQVYEVIDLRNPQSSLPTIGFCILIQLFRRLSANFVIVGVLIQLYLGLLWEICLLFFTTSQLKTLFMYFRLSCGGGNSCWSCLGSQYGDIYFHLKKGLLPLGVDAHIFLEMEQTLLLQVNILHKLCSQQRTQSHYTGILIHPLQYILVVYIRQEWNL